MANQTAQGGELK